MSSGSHIGAEPGIKLVVVDDERTQRLLLSRTLAADWDHEILVAESGAQAIEITDSEQGPFLFLLDWMMPGISGIEVCKHIKSHCCYNSYIIFITGKKQDDDLVQALGAGGDDFVAKPFKREILCSKVRAGLRILDREQKLSVVVKQRESLIEALPDALVAISADQKLQHWNQNAAILFNLDDSRDVGKAFKETHSAWNWDRIESAIDKCAQSGVRVEIPEMEYQFSGYKGYLEVHISSTQDGSSTRGGSLIIARDISIRKQLEADLGQARRMEMIGQLASGVAHEINTPTQFVGDNLEFLQDSFEELMEACRFSRTYMERLSPADKDSYIQALNSVLEESEFDYLNREVPKAIGRSIEGIKHVTEIVQAMNQFAHPGAKEKESLLVNELVETTATVSKNRWKYVADLKFEFEAALPAISAIASEINQVFLNLIVNAAQAIESRKENEEELKGEILIKTVSSDGQIQVLISDNGCGMSKATQERIFDPFFTTKEVGKGTGQGLSICRAIVVDNHGGSIDVKSQVGKGTTFIVSFPRIGAVHEQEQCIGESV